MEIQTSTRAKNILEKKGILTYEDVLNLFPKKYKDYRVQYDLLAPGLDGKDGVFVGYLSDKRANFGQGRSTITVKLNLASKQRISVTFIGQGFMNQRLKNEMGEKVAVFGRLSYNETYGYSILNPDRVLSLKQWGSGYRKFMMMQPVYKKFSGVSEETMEQIRSEAFRNYSCSMEGMTKEEERTFLGAELPDLQGAYYEVHRPSSEEELGKALKKILVTKLFDYALKVERQETGAPKGTSVNLRSLNICKDIQSSLGYDLTEDQKKYLNEMVMDIKQGRRVSALLQGDVGCGKTLVATMMLFAMAENGYQGILVAPTDILAGQHYEEIKRYGEKYQIPVAYYGGKTGKKDKTSILKGLKEGSIKIVVGTQALCSDKIEYSDLGIAIIDEEHRFGVEQKEALMCHAMRGVNILSMSATPIPRTMAGALYGTSMKVYDIHTMPAGRTPVQTATCTQDATVFKFLGEQLAQGRQAYVVCPLIETNDESEVMMGVQSVEEVSEIYKKAFEPKYNVGVLTGKMKKEEVEDVIQRFKAREIQILVSTTVVEVGVNVPNSSVMVISNAERFGLATMHQLRGRVGRGQYKGYCILKSADKDNERLKTMCECTDGFSIAEKDMALRGAGNLIGTEQSGYTEYMALILQNPDLYGRIQECAKKRVAAGSVF